MCRMPRARCLILIHKSMMGNKMRFVSINSPNFVFRIIESPLWPGSRIWMSPRGGVNRRIKIITLKLKFLHYSKAGSQWNDELFE
jgi:hypothetical protein